MRRHDFVYNPICSPSTVWRIMQMWSVCLNNLIEIFNSAHYRSKVFLEPLKTLSFACGKLA